MFLNFFGFAPEKKEARGRDHFLDVVRKYRDIWELALLTPDRVVCCPLVSSLKEQVPTRDEIERHVLIPIGSPGVFVSLAGDKVVFSGIDLVVNNVGRVRVTDVESPPNSYGVTVYRINSLLSHATPDSADAEDMTPSDMMAYVTLLKSHPKGDHIFVGLNEYLNNLCDFEVSDS